MQTFSPEQSSNTIDNKINFKIIYNWLYLGMLYKVNLNVLRRKGKTRKPLDSRGKFLIGTSISKSPNHIKKREEVGH